MANTKTTTGAATSADDAQPAGVPDPTAAAIKRAAAHHERVRALWEMPLAQRLAALKRGQLTFEQCLAWAAREPESCPRINGEWAFLALNTPEVAEHHHTPERPPRRRRRQPT